eukprot:TRINITY_DN36656_c0_g1_i1.p2 TRINITY_DN36656_c0_g1~~TRINITY_DN36656_c0_g1_i1.p2  ORF type:complete len:119 (-),score=17.17 TRINITY_DN36656_c0_g1_i1:59-415(-)
MATDLEWCPLCEKAVPAANMALHSLRCRRVAVPGQSAKLQRSNSQEWFDYFEQRQQHDDKYLSPSRSDAIETLSDEWFDRVETQGKEWAVCPSCGNGVDTSLTCSVTGARHDSLRERT